jgi:Ca2+-binding RTX toxin-like protein
VLDGGNGNDYLEDNLGVNRFAGGGGNDYIQAANNGLRDEIDCGPGSDRADVDALDAVAGCEDVRR